VLHNLLHVPSITKNLISVSKFARDNHVFFEFHPNFCLVKSQANIEVLLYGNVGHDGLYEFPHLKLQPPASCLVSSTSSFEPSSYPSPVINTLCKSAQFNWHLRLGHPNPHSMQTILDLCNIRSSNKNDMFCSACCMGKAHRLHSPLSTTQYSTPLELIYSDLWGPAPVVSSNQFKYYISFIDAATRFAWIYLFKNKSDALNIFKQFKSMVELQFGFSIKYIQTDWGENLDPLPSTYLI
jgi:hypothetical protein